MVCEERDEQSEAETLAHGGTSRHRQLVSVQHDGVTDRKTRLAARVKRGHWPEGREGSAEVRITRGVR
ncbi:MAG: hypothetical protein AMXMBFR64_26800 [Myxococcales bacterium]